MSMTRVLIGGASVRPNWTGGEPLVIRQLTRGLMGRGVQVLIAPHDLDLAGALALGASPTDWDPISLMRSVQLIRRERPDVVLGFYDYDSGLQVAAQKLGVPFVACAHIYWPFCPIGILYIDGKGICSGAEFSKCVAHMGVSVPDAHLPLGLRKLPPILGGLAYAKFRKRKQTLHKAQAVIVPSRRFKKLLEDAGYPTVRAIPPGIDFSEFSGRPWEKSPSKVVFLPTASKDERKGASQLSTVAALLAKSHPEARFVATNSPSTAHVEGTPRLSREELLKLFDRSYLVVVPSIWDDVAPTTVLEGMAASRPVVAYDVGGISEMLVDGQTGILVRRGDTDALADAIGRLLDDETRSRRLGLAGRQRTRSEFTVQKMVDSYLKVIEEVRAS